MENIENIEKFLQTKTGLSETSLKQLKAFLVRENDLLEKSEDEIIDYFKSKTNSLESLNKWFSNIKMYRKFYENTTSKLECQLSKIRELRFKENEKPRERIEINIKTELNELEKLYKDLKENTPALRTDLSSIKIKNYDIEKDNYYLDGEIIFNTLVKKDGKINIKLTNEELIEKLNNKEYKNDYLLDYENMDRNNYESKLCKEVFGIGICEYRKMYITKSFNGLQTPKEILKKAFEIAQQSNTSIEMVYQYYLTD